MTTVNADPRARGIETAVADLKKTAPELAKALLVHRKNLAKILADDGVTEERRAEMVAGEQERANGQIRALEEKVASLQARIASDSAALARPVAGDDPVLRELRLTRAWDRARSQLDGGVDPQTIVRAAAADGDREVLDALREQLPAYLRGRGQDPEHTMPVVEHEGAPLLTDAERFARESAPAADEAAMCAALAIDMVRTEVRGGGSAATRAVVLPVTKDELLNVKDLD